MKFRSLFSRCILMLMYVIQASSLAAAPDLRETLLAEVGKQTAAVRADLLALKTPAQVKDYGARMRRVLMELNAIEHPKPRVNARTVGTIVCERFTIEKVVFESTPGILVPANVYVPKGIRGRVPAVLYVNGHSASAMSGANEMCQGFCSQGYVVMTFDPMGQGERGVYYDRFSGNEHVTEGLRAYAAGMHMGALYIGDGMYAVDYLISRSDVDSTRICVTGNSGGGAQSLYLGALDDRIAVSIPSCFTTLDSLIVADVATHPESIYFAAFAKGITNETLCSMTAPRALLINASKEDFFPIAGTRVVFETAKKVYAATGVPDRVAMFEGEGGHAYPLQKREEAYRFLARIFGTTAKPEPPVDPVTERLTCTKTANIEDEGSKTFADLARERALALKKGRAERLSKLSPVQVRARLSEVLGIKTVDYTPKAKIISDADVISIRDITFEYTASDGFPLTGEMFRVPNTSPKRLVVIVSPLSEFSSLRLAQPYLWAGDAVLMAHPRGTVWAPYNKEGFYKIGVANRDYYFAVGAFCAGRTASGIQATDIIEGVRAARELVPGVPTAMVGDGVLAFPAVYAASLLGGVEELTLRNALTGFEAVAANRAFTYYLHPEVLAVQGILKYFDVPELALASGAKRVTWVNPVDQNEAPLSKEEYGLFEGEVKRLAKVFNLEGRISILRR